MEPLTVAAEALESSLLFPIFGMVTDRFGVSWMILVTGQTPGE
jgi:uncharacterized glyoxalase superfamily protein PhnB